MPCTVKCRCRKSTMTFKNLKPGEIETYDCPACDKEMKETRKRIAKEAASKPSPAQNNPFGRALKKREPAKQAAPKPEMTEKAEALEVNFGSAE